jgi:esterase
LSFICLENKFGLSFTMVGDALRHGSVIFIHGIMGRKSNLSGFINKFHNLYPNLGLIAIDLRNHGDSSKHWPPYTVEACARDISCFSKKLSLRPFAIVGHSFGAKVALLASVYLPLVKQIWMLDCAPGIITKINPLGDGNLSAKDIIDILDTIDWPLPSRKYLVNTLINRGVSQGIALWMTTNLAQDAQGVRPIFDLKEIKSMLLDFVKLDGWPTVAIKLADTQIHLVKAQFGGRLSADDEKKLFSLDSQGNAFYHHLSDAGHFLHVDNPHGLLEIMRKFFPV